MQRLAEKLRALPAVTVLRLNAPWATRARARRRPGPGALRGSRTSGWATPPSAAGAVGPAPALRRRPVENLLLTNNPLNGEASPPRGAAAGGRCAADDDRRLAKLKVLGLSCTQIADAGCATLSSALDRGARRLGPLSHSNPCQRRGDRCRHWALARSRAAVRPVPSDVLRDVFHGRVGCPPRVRALCCVDIRGKGSPIFLVSPCSTVATRRAPRVCGLPQSASLSLTHSAARLRAERGPVAPRPLPRPRGRAGRQARPLACVALTSRAMTGAPGPGPGAARRGTRLRGG